MHVTFSMGTPADRQDILDFGDFVFSKSDRPHDFQTLLPRLYGPQASFEPLHYLVKEDGKIRAMVCVLPMEYQVGETVLKISGVGTVSVHPAARGRGYMKKLMNWALRDMQERGEAFSVLGGQRQRYEYFGYTPSGVKLTYTITRDNLRHRYAGRTFAEITLRPMEEKDWAACHALYQKLPAGTLRSREEFPAILRSWDAVPWTVEKDGKVAGYFCLAAQRILELVLDDPGLLPEVLQGIFQTTGLAECFLSLPDWETSLTPELGHLAEWYRLECDNNYRIFDFPAVARAFLQMKAAYTFLPDGQLSLALTDGQQLTLTVSGGVPSVTETANPDAWQLTPLEAQRLLFTPEGWREIPQAGKNSLARAWFPLPLFNFSQDNC